MILVLQLLLFCNDPQVFLIRVFLSWQPGSTACSGSALLMCNHHSAADAETASELLKRILRSPACTTGAILSLPKCKQDEWIRRSTNADDRHIALPQQRGAGFWEQLFTEVCAFGAAPVGDCTSAKVFVAENDAGGGEVMRMCLGQCLKAGVQEPVWCGTVLGKSKQVRRTVFNQWLDDWSANAASKVARKLARHMSDSEATRTEVLKEMPIAPTPDARLVELNGIDAIKPKGPIHLNIGGTIDAALVDLSDGALKQSPHVGFRKWVPALVCCAEQCVELGLIVAPSMLIRDGFGLYPTRKFVKGETVFTGACAEGVWQKVSAAAECIPKSRTIEINAVHADQPQPTKMWLQDPEVRFPWTAANSTHGTNLVAQLQPTTQGNVMGDDFLRWVATQEIEPFSTELFWSYTLVPEVRSSRRRAPGPAELECDASEPRAKAAKTMEFDEDRPLLDHVAGTDAAADTCTASEDQRDTSNVVPLDSGKQVADDGQRSASLVKDEFTEKPHTDAQDHQTEILTRFVDHPTGEIYYCQAEKEMYLILDNKKKRCPARQVYVCSGGSVNRKAAFCDTDTPEGPSDLVEYTVTKSTKVYLSHEDNGTAKLEFGKISELREKFQFNSVFGKGKFSASGALPSKMRNSDGSILQLFYRAPLEHRRSAALFLECDQVESYFMFEVKDADLCPVGLVFYLGKSVTLPQAGVPVKLDLLAAC